MRIYDLFDSIWHTYIITLQKFLERMKEKTSAGAARNLSKKLHPNDILRKFAIGMTVVSDCHRTLRMKMTSITLPFDSRKSRKFTENPADLGTSKTTFSLQVYRKSS